MLIFLLFLSIALASTRLFERSSFLSIPTPSNTLETRLNQLKTLESQVDSFSHNLLKWGDSYHSFKLDLESQILQETLSHSGQTDFQKELIKCGITKQMKTEDFDYFKTICIENPKNIEDFVNSIMKQIYDEANSCINVKEKYRIRIRTMFDERLLQEFEGNKVFLQVEGNEDRFNKVAKRNLEKFEKVCGGLVSVIGQLKDLKGSTNEVLDGLLG